MNITFVDNKDGSGGVFSVTGNAGLATIRASLFLGTNASRAFAIVGTISGNGSVAFSPADVGPYVGVAINDVGDVAPPIVFRVSDQTEALQVQLLKAVREYILSLALPGVSTNPDHHVISKLPYRSNTDLTIDTTTDTCVWYFPKTESYQTADTTHDKVIYPVQVLLVRKIGSQTHKGLYSMLMDRQLIGQSTSRVPFADAPCFYDVEFLPGEPYNPQHWAAGVDVSSVVVRGITEQVSGIF